MMIIGKNTIETYSSSVIILYRAGFPINQFCAEILDKDGVNLFPYDYFWSSDPIEATQKALKKFEGLNWFDTKIKDTNKDKK